MDRSSHVCVYIMYMLRIYTSMNTNRTCLQQVLHQRGEGVGEEQSPQVQSPAPGGNTSGGGGGVCVCICIYIERVVGYMDECIQYTYTYTYTCADIPPPLLFISLSTPGAGSSAKGMGAAPGCGGFSNSTRSRSRASAAWQASCHSWGVWSRGLWVSAQRVCRTAASEEAECRLRSRVCV